MPPLLRRNPAGRAYHLRSPPTLDGRQIHTQTESPRFAKGKAQNAIILLSLGVTGGGEPVRGWTHITYEVAGIASVCGVVFFTAALGLIRARRRWRRKNPEELERLRRLRVSRDGRIASAEIIDWADAGPADSSSRALIYRYEVAGVTYEAAQVIANFPSAALLAEGLSGLESHVKYDPRNPANSIIACEEWSGLKPAKPAVTAKPEAS